MVSVSYKKSASKMLSFGEMMVNMVKEQKSLHIYQTQRLFCEQLKAPFERWVLFTQQSRPVNFATELFLKMAKRKWVIKKSG